MLTERQAAEALQIPYHTLKRLRMENKVVPSVPFYNIGGSVRYKLEDLVLWVRTQTHPTNRGRPKRDTVHDYEQYIIL